MRCLANMKMNVLVSGALYSSQSSLSALEFCSAASQAGHVITQVFFYQDGVGAANRFSAPLDDEFEPVSAWSEFAKINNTELVVCVSAGERRGIMSGEQSQEFAKDTGGVGSLHSAFTVAGLGVLHQASLAADRTVTFK